jgi:all-trans-8'-apo-beta-carotenal 15,15'-oxygenase
MSIALDSVASDLDQVLFRKHQESSYCIDSIEGSIPDYVRGTRFLNGPANFERGERRYRNWLDGDGMVCSLRFDKDSIRFTNRFVRTRKFVCEEAVGAFLYRTFGTAFAGDKLKRGLSTETPANVSVVLFDNCLLAFGEQSVPIELDPDTLDTIGPFDFDGQLNDISPFSAHPKIDAATGELLNFGIAFSARQPLLHYYRFDASGRLQCRSRIPLDRPCSLHDFAVSPSYASFYLSPDVLNMDRLRSGAATIDSMDWINEPSQLLILNRENGEEVARIPIERGYSLHTINSFERDGCLILDVVEMKRPVYSEYQPLPDLFRSPPRGKPVRFVIDVDAATIIEKQIISYVGTPDFPCIHSDCEVSDYDRCWMLGIPAGPSGESKFFTQLLSFRWSAPESPDIYSISDGRYLAGEPVCVANPERTDESVIVCQEYDAVRDTGAILMFDSLNIEQGPIARIRLAEPIHFGFHATSVHEVSAV